MELSINLMLSLQNAEISLNIVLSASLNLLQQYYVINLGTPIIGFDKSPAAALL